MFCPLEEFLTSPGFDSWSSPLKALCWLFIGIRPPLFLAPPHTFSLYPAIFTSLSVLAAFFTTKPISGCFLTGSQHLFHRKSRLVISFYSLFLGGKV